VVWAKAPGPSAVSRSKAGTGDAVRQVHPRTVQLIAELDGRSWLEAMIRAYSDLLDHLRQH
jgi:hypothetical protein